MAQLTALDAAANIQENLSSKEFQEIGRVWFVGDDLERLVNTICRTRDVLLDYVILQRYYNNREIRFWLKKLEDVLYDAEDLLGDFSIESRLRSMRSQNKRTEKVRTFFSSSNYIVHKLILASKLKRLRRKIDAIIAVCSPLRLDARFKNTCTERKVSTLPPPKLIGRDRERDEVIGQLLDRSSTERDVSVISIVGVAGIGKTSLAKYVYDDERVQKHFELTRWVSVSNDHDFDIERIIGTIIDAEEYNLCLSLDDKERRLLELIRRKRYLLVLDGLWKDDELKRLKLKDHLAEGGRGSKILITTQSEIVSEAWGSVETFPISRLSRKESLDLFLQIAFNENQLILESEKVSIGEEIVSECDDIPLVIRLAGSVFTSRRTKKAWLDAKEKELPRILHEGSDLYDTIKPSYDKLPPHLKRCFAFCSIFPRDSVISKATLIDLWIAEGLIQPPSSEDLDLKAVAHEHFLNLLANNFFQDKVYDEFGNVETCKMHGHMHNLARMVDEGGHAVVGDSKATHADITTHHLYYKSNSDLLLGLETWLDNARLRTLVSIEPNIPFVKMTRQSEHIFLTIASRFKFLRALTVHNTDMKVLPKSLFKLKHLYYLDVSYNKLLERLPSDIERMQNLVTLKLIACYHLKDLPGEIKNLASLRYLDVGDHYCSLNHMPSGLGQLTSLHNLSCFIVGVDKDNPKKCASLSELRGLSDLRGKLTISFHCYVDNAEGESKAADMRGKKFLKDLELCWKHVEGNEHNESEVKENHETLLEGLQPSKNLQRMRISSYKGENFPRWMTKDFAQFHPNVAVLDIFDCDRCRNLPPLGLLPHLHTLRIDGLRLVDSLDHADYGTSSSNSTSRSPFPCLSRLSIVDCPKLESMPRLPNLKELSVTNVSAELLKHPFPGLKHLTIRSIQFRESLPENWFRDLSSLEELWIQNCPSLTSLSTGKGDSITYTSYKYEVIDPPINDNDNVMQQPEGFRSLRVLMIDNLPGLASLPNWLFHVTTLKKLSLNNCSNLIVSLDHVGDLASLELQISGCPKCDSQLPKFSEGQKGKGKLIY